MGSVYDLFFDDEPARGGTGGASSIDEAADRHGIPRQLAAALVQTESGGRADAVSSKGARGRTQVMPGTMREMGYDPDTATPEEYDDAGMRYLRQQYDRFGDWKLALAAYHAGPGAVRRAGGMPNTSDGIMRTPDYADRIAGRAGLVDGAAGPAPAAATQPRSVIDMMLGDDTAPPRDDMADRWQRALQAKANAPVGLGEEIGRGLKSGIERLGAGMGVVPGRSNEGMASDLADVAQIPRSAAQQQYEKQLKAATDAFDAASGFAESTSAFIGILKAVGSSPTQAARTTVESLASSAPAFAGAAAGAGAGMLAGGPVGSVIGGLVGFIGGSLATNTQVEMASRLDEQLRAKGVDPSNRDAVIAALEQDPTMVPDARRKAILSGVTTTAVEGVVDVATFGMARITKPARTLLGTAMRATGAAGAQGVGEGLGAYAGDLAAGDDPSAGAAIAEGVLGIIPGAPEAAAAVYAGRKLPLAAALSEIGNARTTDDALRAAAAALGVQTVDDGLTGEQRDERGLRMGEARLRGLNLVDDAQAIAAPRDARDAANRAAGGGLIDDAQAMAQVQDDQRALRLDDARATGAQMVGDAQDVAELRRMNRDADNRERGDGMVRDIQTIDELQRIPRSLIGGAVDAGTGPAAGSTVPRESGAADNDYRPFGPESGSLGVPRAEMPQVRPETHGPLVNFLKARGVESELAEVPAGTLRPTQAEYSPSKVESARAAGAGERRVLVSSDGYVVDGHHRWLSAFMDEAPVRVIRLSAPATQLLDLIREFPSAGLADGGMEPAGRFDPQGLRAGTPEYEAAFQQWADTQQGQRDAQGTAGRRAENQSAVEKRDAWRNKLREWFLGAKDGDTITDTGTGQAYKVVEKVRKDGTKTKVLVAVDENGNALPDGRAATGIAQVGDRVDGLDNGSIDEDTGAAYPETEGQSLATSLGKMLEDGDAKTSSPARAAAQAKADDALRRMAELLGDGAPAAPGLVDAAAAAPEPKVRERTPKQLAAQKAKREGFAKKNPFLTFLGKHGVSMKLQRDITGETGKKGNRTIPYWGPMFRNDGLNIDMLAERAAEAGFLSAADLADETDFQGTRKLSDMILRAFKGEKVMRPADDAAALEQQMQDAYEDFAATEAEQDGEEAEAPEVEEAAVAVAEAFDEDELNAMLQAVGWGTEELDDAQLEAIAEDGLAALIAEADAEADAGTGPAEAPVAAPADARADAGGQDQGDAGGKPQGLIDQAAAPAPAAPDFTLEAPTPEQLTAEDDARRRAAADKAKKDAAPPPDDFMLTGSDRPADVAAAAGQTALFDAPPVTDAVNGKPEGMSYDSDRMVAIRAITDDAERLDRIATMGADSIQKMGLMPDVVRSFDITAASANVQPLKLREAVIEKLREAGYSEERLAFLARKLGVAEKKLSPPPKRTDTAAPSPAPATPTTEKEPTREGQEGNEAAASEVLTQPGGREAPRLKAPPKKGAKPRTWTYGGPEPEGVIYWNKNENASGEFTKEEFDAAWDLITSSVGKFLLGRSSNAMRIEAADRDEPGRRSGYALHDMEPDGTPMEDKGWNMPILDPGMHALRNGQLYDIDSMESLAVPARIVDEAPTVPPRVRDRLKIALDRLREIRRELDDVVRARGKGATLASVLGERRPAIDKAMETVREFERLANENRINAQKVFGDLGGMAYFQDLEGKGDTPDPGPAAPKLAPPPKKTTKAQQKAEQEAKDRAASDAYYQRRRDEAKELWKVGMVTGLPTMSQIDGGPQQQYTAQLPGVIEAIRGGVADVRIYAAPEYGYTLENYPLHGKLATNVPLEELGRFGLNDDLQSVADRGLLETGDPEIAQIVRDRVKSARQPAKRKPAPPPKKGEKPAPPAAAEYTTPGTNLTWSDAAGWMDAAETLERRPPASNKYKQQRAHMQALAENLKTVIEPLRDAELLDKLHLKFISRNPVTSQATGEQRVAILNAVSRAQNAMGKAAAGNRPKPPPKAGSDEAKMAAAKAKAAKALDDLANLLGGKKNITPEEQRKLLPIMVELMDAFATMGTIKFKQLAKQVLDAIRGHAQMGPKVADQITLRDLQSAYLSVGQNHEGSDEPAAVFTVRSLDELAGAAQDGPQGANDVPGGDTDLERDRLDAAAGDEEVGADVPPAPGGARPGSGRRGGSAGGGRSARPRDPSLPGPGTTTGREQGGDEVRGGDREPLPSDLPPGVDESARVDDPRPDGVPADAEGDDLPVGDDRDTGQVDKARAQRAAQGVKTRPGDRRNIDEALPYLTDGQRADVKFAEDRFAKADGHGVLFTNGTGTGKTFSGLGIVRRFVSAGRGNVLILVPSDKIATDWVASGGALQLDIKQLRDTKDNGGSGVVVTSYANAGMNNALALRKWDLVVSDEAHKLSENANGDPTDALRAVRAITGHPDGKWLFAQKRYPVEHAAMTAASQALSAANRSNDTPTEVLRQLDAEDNRARAAWEAVKAKAEVEFDRIAANRPKAVFLSATPFAYEKSTDWANGYLYDYAEAFDGRTGYNSGSAQAQFMIRHFGYRMRTGKLTEPGPEVDRGLMQREFNSWLKRAGVLSARALDVPFDYDRRFQTVESGIGNRIDAALEWLGDSTVPGRGALRERIDAQFDYLTRRRLLEAIKAQEVVPIVRAQLNAGRKVLVFHDYRAERIPFHPFQLQIDPKDTDNNGVPVLPVYEQFKREFKDLLAYPFQLQGTAIETLTREFGDQVLLFNGAVSKGERRKNVGLFNGDESGRNLILVQSAAGREGISLHDTTGRMQRVLYHLGLPTAPTAAIQQEGRIMRYGQASNAMFRYLNTGTSWERWAFASTIARRASAAENLAQGEEARGLLDSFITAFEASGDFPPGHEGEGTGGKALDRALAGAISLFQRAKSYYFAQPKKNARTKSQEGVSYFATPEPLGLKMVEWAGQPANARYLEPSAGHGAIARWFPDTAQRTAIEPSAELSSRLALAFDSKIVRERFEDHDIVNKYDAIVMNPPFNNEGGVGGKLAAEHLIKAWRHLAPGGRLVAIIPDGPAMGRHMEKVYDAWGEQNRKEKVSVMTVARAQIDLPPVTFERAATQVRARVIVFEKRPTDWPIDERGHTQRDLSTEESIGDFFDRLEGITVPAVAPPITAQTQPADAPPSASAPATSVRSLKTWEQAHSQSGATLFMAAPTERVDSELYRQLADLAKKHSGYYSRYQNKAQGVKPGFVFKTAMERRTFEDDAKQAMGERPAMSRAPDASVTARRGISVGGMPIRRLTKVVDGIRSKWANAPDIEVVASAEQLPDAVRAEVAAQEAGGAQAAPQGVYWRGTVYLVADQLPTEGAVVETLLHEALGHYGLRGVFGAQLNPFLDRLAMARPAQMRQKARDYGMSLSNLEERRAVAEELLAEMAQTSPELDLVQRVIAWVRGFLRDVLGLPVSWSDADIVAKAILPARRFVEQGTGAAPSGAPAAAARAASPFYSELARRISEAKSSAMPGEQWAKWLDGNSAKLGIKADEVEWSGVREYLAMQGKARVTREQLVAFLDENGTRVDSTLRGAAPPPDDPAERLREMAPEEMRVLEDAGVRLVFDDEGDGSATMSMDVPNAVVAAGDPRVDASIDTIDSLWESIRSEYDSDDFGPTGGTRYSSYVTPGGTDYRELLVTLPAKDKIVERRVPVPNGWGDTAGGNVGVERTGDTRADYRSGHWDEPNVLVHTRFDTRTDADGKRVLFVHEIQSDWGQAGRKKGFRVDTPRTGRIVQDGPRYGGDGFWYAILWDDGERTGGFGSRESAERQLQDRAMDGRASTPRAPFVTDTKAWVGLALKRLIRHAAETGHDRIVLTTGEQAAEVFDLSRQVDSIRVARTSEDHFNIVASKGRQDVLDQGASLDQLEGMIGKDLAKKAAELKVNEDAVYSGLDLKVGGEGMKAFYDRLVPQVAREVVKKLGAGAVGMATLGGRMSARDIDRFTEANGYPPDQDATTQHPAIDITPDLRSKAMAGLPMFQRGPVAPSEAEVRTWSRDQLSKWLASVDAEYFDPQPVPGIRIEQVADGWIVPNDEGEDSWFATYEEANQLARELRYPDDEPYTRAELLDVVLNVLREQMQPAGGADVKVLRPGGASNDVRFSRPASTATWDTPAPTKLDDFLYTLQDKQIDMKRVVGAVKAKVGQIADRWNPYLQEELYHGRTAKRTKDFLDLELRPLLTDMQMRGVALADFETYLHNRHAEERNEQIAKINDKFPDGGSGIKTKAARKYLENLDDKQRRAFEALAAKVDAISNGTRRALVDAGLEKQSTIDAWGEAYEKYVPLMRDEVEDEQKPGTGMGFSIRGPASQRAIGSDRKVVDILANLAMQRERAIVRGEKNRVSQALYGLALKNPNTDFWKPVNPQRFPAYSEKQRQALIDELAGMGLDEDAAEGFVREPAKGRVERFKDENGKWTERVVYRANPAMRGRDNVLSLRVNGEDRYVFFNATDDRAKRMATSLKNLDVDQLGRVLSAAGMASRWFASVNTQYNPIFGVVNLTRDVQSALFNLSTTPIAGKQAAVLGHTVSALRGIYADIRAHRAGKVPSSSWAQLWEEFQKEGGQTGFRDMWARAEDRSKALEKEIAQIGQGKARGAGRAIFNWLSDYNDTLENATRLAAYKVALEQGMSKQQAASLAKNLTVNFNRKGQVAQQAGALYAFFNASVQGTARLAETLAGPAGKKIIAGGLAIGVMQALLLAAAGFDDDDPPEFVRERNLVLPIGGKQYVTIPMPLGLHVLPSFSRITTEWALSGFKKPGDRVAQLAGLLAETFNPIGNAGISLQTITPTVVDPLAALAENKDFSGRPIARENMSSLQPKPGFERTRDSASWGAKQLAYWLNLASGGTDFVPGLLSPTPDQIDYLVGQVTGGVGRELLKTQQTVGGLASGEEIAPYKMPLVGRFYGDAESGASESSRFYENLKAVYRHKSEMDGRRRQGEPIAPYIRENPDARLVTLATQTDRDLDEMRKERRAAAARGASSEQVRRLDEQMKARMRAFNERVAALSQ